MKKFKKGIFTLVIVVIIATVSILQLRSNKAENDTVVELANVTGSFYPVKTMKVNSEIMKSSLVSNGFLKPVTDLYVVSETQGRVVEIYKNKGDFVKTGDVILKVEDELLQAQLRASKATLKKQEKDKQRFLRLKAENAVTQQQLEEVLLNLELTKAKYINAVRQLDDTKIKAPVSGIINEDFIELGQFISGGSKVCNIVDISKLKLNIKIAESKLSKVKKGQKVEIMTSVYPDDKFIGSVGTIAQKAGVGNRFDVEIVLSNTERNVLKGGMYVEAKIVDESAQLSFFIPRQAINGSLKDASIYSIKGTKVEEKKLVVKSAQNGKVEVIKGLKEGDEIVVAGNYNIYDGATVKVVN